MHVDEKLNKWVARIKTRELAVSTLLAFDTPLSISLANLLREKKDRLVAECSFDPALYGPDDYVWFTLDFAAYNLCRKARWLQTGIDTRKVALDAFKAAENQCRITNIRLSMLSNPRYAVSSSRWSEVIHKARGIIGRILGPFDREAFFENGGWGKKNSQTCKGERSDYASKFQLETGTTPELAKHLPRWIAREYPAWVLTKRLTLQGFCKVTTVPKNARTDRCIASEPGFNIWFQRSIGQQIRKRLKRAGIDLNDQYVNADLARYGSFTGRLVTVDFSAASDTVSKLLVELLLPEDWFAIMDLCRSKRAKVGSEIFDLEKFSSMGNGFTFELESLIFYALALAVGSNKAFTSVYGDDVVMDVDSYDAYAEICAFCGFTVNRSKSFSTGLFRESCGAYWFQGKDVKPYFIKDEVVSLPQVYTYLNQLKRLSARPAGVVWDLNVIRLRPSAQMMALRREVLNDIPSRLRYFGPDSLGDSVIHDEGWVSSRYAKWDCDLQTISVASLAAVPKSREDQTYGMLLVHLWRLGNHANASVLIRDVALGNMIAVRSDIYEYGVVRTPVVTESVIDLLQSFLGLKVQIAATNP